MSDSLSDSVKQINDNSWLIGKKFILLRTVSAEKPLWKDKDNHCYSLSDNVLPLPPANPLSPEDYPQLVHSCANASAVWAFGDVFLKIKIFQTRQICTRENVNLDWLAIKERDFDIPRALHYSEDEDRSYLFATRVHGITLNRAWPSMGEDDRQYFAERIAEICIHLSTYSSATLGGIDSSRLPDGWLDPFDEDFRSETLRANCIQLGMEISSSTKFLFFHNDLGPGNIMIDPQEKRLVGIIDWELAGFVPREWISTKFAVGWGLDLELGEAAGISDADWRKRVHKELKRRGFPDVSDAWNKWFNERYALRKQR